MGGFRGQWNVGSKGTEKHFGGQSRQLANCVVTEGLVTDGGGLVANVPAVVSLISGYEQRKDATTVNLANNSTNYVWLQYNESWVVTTTPAEPSGFTKGEDVELIAKVVTVSGSITQIINFDNHGCVDNRALKFSSVGVTNFQKGSPKVSYNEATNDGTPGDVSLFTVNPNAKSRFGGIRILHDGGIKDRKAERIKLFFDGATAADIDLSFDEAASVGLNGISGVLATASPYIHTMEILTEGDFATMFEVKVTLESTDTAVDRISKSITKWEKFVL